MILSVETFFLVALLRHVLQEYLVIVPTLLTEYC